jgi:hypothetical protein
MDKSVHKHIVRPHENLGTIARAEHTTVTELQADNPWALPAVHAGEDLTFYRASMIREIYAFDQIDVQFLTNRYNGRDREYASKMRYILNNLQ